MDIDEITAYVSGLPGVLTLRPKRGDGSPEIAWGDVFFYYAPDGIVPRTQPFATIVTKDYPGDASSRLDRPDAFRVNVHVGSAEGAARIADAAPDEADAIIAHPVYGRMGWIAVVTPGPRTADALRDLLRSAHARAADRFRRRADRP